MTVFEGSSTRHRAAQIKSYWDYRYFLVTQTVKFAVVDMWRNAPEYCTEETFFSYATLKRYLNNYNRDLWIRIFTVDGWSYLVNSNSCYWLNWAAE